MDGAKLAVGLGLIGAIGVGGFVLLRPKAKVITKTSNPGTGVDNNLPPVTAVVATGYAPVIFKEYDGSKIGLHLNLLDGYRYQGTVFFA